jgi:hypothetical protein
MPEPISCPIITPKMTLGRLPNMWAYGYTPEKRDKTRHVRGTFARSCIKGGVDLEIAPQNMIRDEGIG